DQDEWDWSDLSLGCCDIAPNKPLLYFRLGIYKGLKGRENRGPYTTCHLGTTARYIIAARLGWAFLRTRHPARKGP
ncbi:hypothetical protein CFOL_v3_36413, partial [Cephalotus follicularis]